MSSSSIRRTTSGRFVARESSTPEPTKGRRSRKGSSVVIERKTSTGLPPRVKITTARRARAEAALVARPLGAQIQGAARLEAAVRRYERGIDVPDPAVSWHAQQNAVLREELLQEFGAFTPGRLAEVAGSRSARANDTLYNWTRHRRVVAVDYGGQRLVPGFYITPEGVPDALAGPVIAVLDQQGASEWQQALWWTAARWQLHGRRGVDVLVDARSAPREERARVGRALVTAADEPRDFF